MVQIALNGYWKWRRNHGHHELRVERQLMPHVLTGYFEWTRFDKRQLTADPPKAEKQNPWMRETKIEEYVHVFSTRCSLIRSGYSKICRLQQSNVSDYLKHVEAPADKGISKDDEGKDNCAKDNEKFTLFIIEDIISSPFYT